MEYMKYILGTVLIMLALLKIVDWKIFAERYRTYDVIAKKIPLYAYLYPITELILGCMYFIVREPYLIATLTLLLVLMNFFSLLKRFETHQSFQITTPGMLIPIALPVFSLIEDVLTIGLTLIVLFAL